MIEVSISCDEIKISGHAGYAEIGKDIVCAGVSVLVYTLEKALQVLCENEIESSESAEETIICLKNISEKGKVLVDAFFIGIIGIIELYPEYVKLAP